MFHICSTLSVKLLSTAHAFVLQFLQDQQKQDIKRCIGLDWAVFNVSTNTV